MTSSFKAVFEDTQGALKAEPARGLATFEAVSRQVEGLKSEIRVRDFNLIVDEPPELGGSNEGPNPVELILASLATCQEITYRLYADSLGIPLDRVSVKVSGDIDLRGFFAVDDGVRPGFESIRTEVTLEGPASESEFQRLRDSVDRHCPVLDILQNATPVSLKVTSRSGALAAE
jgi:uncharacterized OsmC-like protein